jgi:hypothetical protein
MKGNDDIHQRLTRGRARFKHGGDVDGEFRQPSHEFTFGVDMSFILYPLVLTPLVQQVHLCMSVLEFSVYAGFYVESKTSGISSSSTL